MFPRPYQIPIFPDLSVFDGTEFMFFFGTAQWASDQWKRYKLIEA